MARRNLTAEAQRVFEEGLEGKSLKELKTLYSSWRGQTEKRLKNLQGTTFTSHLSSWKTPEYRKLKDLGIGKKAPDTGSEEEKRQMTIVKDAIYQQSYFLRTGITKKKWNQIEKKLNKKDFKMMNKMAAFGFIDASILPRLYDILTYVNQVLKKETSPIPGKQKKNAKGNTSIAEILGLNRATADILDFDSLADPEVARKIQNEVYTLLDRWESEMNADIEAEVAKAVEDAKFMSTEELIRGIEDQF